MLNDISYEVTSEALEREHAGPRWRTIQPGGEFILEPGERLVRVWAGADAAPPAAEPPAPQRRAPSALEPWYAIVDRIATDMGAYDADQIALDGSEALAALWNHWNVPGYPGEHVPAGPFGFVKWQLGPTGGPDGRVNGTTIEDLLELCLARLAGFQAGPFGCRENALAITGMETARNWLLQRRRAREAQGVAGLNAAHADPLWPGAPPVPMEIQVRHEGGTPPHPVGTP